MTDDQLRHLRQLYLEVVEAGGPRRNELAYSDYFEWIYARFTLRFGPGFTRQAVYGRIVYLDKHPSVRRRLGLE